MEFEQGVRSGYVHASKKQGIKDEHITFFFFFWWMNGNFNQPKNYYTRWHLSWKTQANRLQRQIQNKISQTNHIQREA